ncbi:MAG: hypothetical protein ABI859_00450 [Pseudomonadota bacterium]
MSRGFLCALFLVAGTTASAQLPEPGDAHPRLFSEAGVDTSLRQLAGKRDSYVAQTVERCRTITADPARYSNDLYMGLDWAQYVQACLVAYKASGNQAYGRTALIYFKALIDDLKVVGDGAGGDAAARRDSGFAMRALGPNAALAYDWLHDFPGVDEALRARARQRFRAWTDWYLTNGYRARSPGTNYNAGYVFAATTIAVAQGGEAGADGTRLWNHVINDLLLKDLLPAMTGDGVLVGGDWNEGWQYGPLSVAEYALSLRAVARYGLDVTRAGPWFKALVTRHVYGLVPGGGTARTYAVGDTQTEDAHLAVRAETLAAVLIGPAEPAVKQWAESEMRRLRLYDEKEGFPLFRALAQAELVEPVEFPRTQSSSRYLSIGSGTLYARFSWSDDGAWLAAPCSRARDVDHMHPNAGSFVLSRGRDDVIVDPSPYGTLSSLTSNAPTSESGNLPASYQPSQAFWATRTGFDWIWQAADGMLVARCDYADQYRIQQTPTDVLMALRDFVIVPLKEGRDVVAIVVDRARTPGEGKALHLRFRVLADIALRDGAYVGTQGKTRLTIRPVTASAGQSDLRRVATSSCFQDGYTRGNCDAARFNINEYRLKLKGPQTQAVHVVSAVAGEAPGASLVRGEGMEGTLLALVDRNLIVVTGNAAKGTITIPARSSTVVLLDADAGLALRATSTPQGCALTALGAQGGAQPAMPLVTRVSADCQVSREP